MIIDNERRPADDKRLGNGVTRRGAAAMLAFGGLGGSARLNYAQPAAPAAPQVGESLARVGGASVGSADFGLVRFREEAFPPIAVQSVGAALPAWVEPDDPGTPRILEIVLVRERSPISDRGGVGPAMRIMLTDEAIGDMPLPECLFSIRGASANLDALAQTLVRIVTGPTIVGIDFADVRSSASFRFGSPFQSALERGSCLNRPCSTSTR